MRKLYVNFKDRVAIDAELDILKFQPKEVIDNYVIQLVFDKTYLLSDIINQKNGWEYYETISDTTGEAYENLEFVRKSIVASKNLKDKMLLDFEILYRFGGLNR